VSSNYRGCRAAHRESRSGFAIVTIRTTKIARENKESGPGESLLVDCTWVLSDVRVQGMQ